MTSPIVSCRWEESTSVSSFMPDRIIDNRQWRWQTLSRAVPSHLLTHWLPLNLSLRVGHVSTQADCSSCVYMPDRFPLFGHSVCTMEKAVNEWLIVMKAVNKLKNGKTVGIDQIRPELLKYSKAIIPELTKLCNAIWKSKIVPSDWKNRIIIPLPKVTWSTAITGGVSHCCLYQAKFFKYFA